MINPGDFIYVDGKGKMFSKPKEGRNYLGQYGLDNENSMKEGTVLRISITKKGRKEVERLKREKIL